MGRRTWIKIFSEKWLRGGIRQESAALRGTFVDLLTMAGDSAYADEGTIRVTKGCGLTDEQVCKVLNLEPIMWAEYKARLVAIGYLKITEANEITVVEWSRFQSDYQRTKDAPSRRSKSTVKSTRESTGKKKKEKKKEKLEGEEGKDLVSGIKTPETLSAPPTGAVLMAHWNGKDQLPKIQTWNEERQKKLRIRAKDKQFCLYWRDAIDALCRSPFHLGENDRHWVADVGYFLGTDRAGNTNWNKCWEREITEGVRHKRTREQIEAGEVARLKRIEEEEAAKRGAMTPAGKALADRLMREVEGGTDEVVS